MPSRRDLIRMNEEEVAGFIEAGKSLQLATINKDGSPHLVTMWYGIMDGRIAIETFEKSQKAVNLRRDARVACLLESEKFRRDGCENQYHGGPPLFVARVSKFVQTFLRTIANSLRTSVFFTNFQ